jgi:hypothetical protein
LSVKKKNKKKKRKRKSSIKMRKRLRCNGSAKYDCVKRQRVDELVLLSLPDELLLCVAKFVGDDNDDNLLKFSACCVHLRRLIVSMNAHWSAATTRRFASHGIATRGNAFPLFVELGRARQLLLFDSNDCDFNDVANSLSPAVALRLLLASDDSSVWLGCDDVLFFDLPVGRPMLTAPPGCPWRRAAGSSDSIDAFVRLTLAPFGDVSAHAVDTIATRVVNVAVAFDGQWTLLYFDRDACVRVAASPHALDVDVDVPRSLKRLYAAHNGMSGWLPLATLLRQPALAASFELGGGVWPLDAVWKMPVTGADERNVCVCTRWFDRARATSLYAMLSDGGEGNSIAHVCLPTAGQLWYDVPVFPASDTLLEQIVIGRY